MKKIPYGYDVLWYRVVDGDTIHLKLQREVEVEVDFGFKLKQTITTTQTFEDNLRLEGINTPEIRGEERPQGLISKDYLKSLLPEIIEYDDGTKEMEDANLYAVTYKQGKYGRYLVTLYLQNTGPIVENINLKLVHEGYAELYNEKKPVSDPLGTGVSSEGYLEDFIDEDKVF